MTVSATLYQWGGKEKNTRHKETTNHQTVLLYTTPLFTLHSKSLHVPSNQLIATEALYTVCKEKNKQKIKKKQYFCRFPAHSTLRKGMWQDKIRGRVHPLDRLAPTQRITDFMYSLGFSKTGFGDSAEDLSLQKNQEI